jgi:CheY-like chemotaxis protein
LVKEERRGHPGRLSGQVRLTPASLRANLRDGDRLVARILLIDDEQAVRVLLTWMLTKAGHDVIAASDGADAARLYRANHPDLVITDILMPEKEGIETIIELRRDFPDVKIIAISGGGATMTQGVCLHLARRLGAERTLEKPMSYEELIRAVDEVLNP